MQGGGRREAGREPPLSLLVVLIVEFLWLHRGQEANRYKICRYSMQNRWMCSLDLGPVGINSHQSEVRWQNKKATLSLARR